MDVLNKYGLQIIQDKTGIAEEKVIAEKKEVKAEKFFLVIYFYFSFIAFT